MQRALELDQAKEARVILILMRPVDWKGAPFAHLQALPTDARPITLWENRDAAFADVAAGILRAIEDLSRLAISLPQSAFPALWNVPLTRNPFFTGREELLSRLHTQLHQRQISALSQPQRSAGWEALASLPVEARREWMQRVVLTINVVFPFVEVENWLVCERLLPHAFQSANWIAQAPMASQKLPVCSIRRPRIYRSALVMRKRSHCTSER